jgi:hypothetical protein
MAARVATYAAKRMMRKKLMDGELEKYKDKPAEGVYDPYYEDRPHPTKPGKTKKVKKQVPGYIPTKDAEILAKSRKRAYKLDYCLFNFLGFRFGWSSVIGLVPVAGDGMDAALALQLIWWMYGAECGLPLFTLFRMFLNMGIDFAVGLIPIVGDLADAAIKCNSKNVRLFESHLDSVYKPKELIEEEDREYEQAKREHRDACRPRPATVYDDFSDEDMERFKALDDDRHDIRQPQRAHSGRRERLPDEEMGIRHDTRRSHKEQPSRNATKGGRRK